MSPSNSIEKRLPLTEREMSIVPEPAERASAAPPCSGPRIAGREGVEREVLAGGGLALRDAVVPLTPAQVTRGVSVLVMAAVAAALLDLAVRAAVRLETRWDAVVYHLPFAALRGGVPLTYDMSDIVRPYWEGFPPLPHVAQGLLWRLTGSVNSTGVVNFAAFLGLLVYAHRCLGARSWQVAMIALTAPMVVIHAASSYVDLFSNSFLTVGASSCLYLCLFPDVARRTVLVGGLIGLVAAAWSKFQLVPVVAAVFCLYGAIALSRRTMAGLSRRWAIAAIAGAALIAALPYVKNMIAYGNPFWPVRLPVLGDRVPFQLDPVGAGAEHQRPRALLHLSRFELFWHSLFEINHPTSYPHRARWIIDQGNAALAFRMGGFWGIAAAFYVVAFVATLSVAFRRRGVVAAAGALALLAFVAVLPQSHELRYYLFIPLCGAVAIAMSWQKLEALAPRAALVLLVTGFGLFSYMVSENWVHYRVERFGQAQAAAQYGADTWWPLLERGKRYCAVGLMPRGMFMTGPTLTEYTIIERSQIELCPPDTEVLPRALRASAP